MRIFTAIEIPEEAKVSIQKIISKIATMAICKWVKKENLHITLKFFGEVESSVPIEEALSKICEELQPFNISLSGLGAFPSKSRVKVLWVGVEEGKEKITELYKKIDDSCEPLGFREKRKDFTPHITIGRVKKGKLIFPDIDFSYPEFTANKITLFESILTPSGPIYNRIANFPREED